MKIKKVNEVRVEAAGLFFSGVGMAFGALFLSEATSLSEAALPAGTMLISFLLLDQSMEQLIPRIDGIGVRTLSDVTNKSD